MASPFRLAQLLLFCLLSSLCSGNVWPRRDGFLRVRQDGSTVGGNEPVDAACVALCDPDTCGSSVCPNQKRDLSQLDSTGRFLVGNRSTEEWYPPIGGNDLRKRILEYPTRGGWTPLRTAQYLSGMITGLGTADTQYTPTTPELIYPVFGDSETTVSQEEALGATKLQVGNGGLHGCTELTVISKRYVYMAHYWETYTTGGDDNLNNVDSTTGQNKWQTRVINTLIGGQTDTVLPPAGSGPITPGNYNNQNDQSVAIVLTPFRDATAADVKNGWKPQNTNDADFKYPQKIAAIEAALKSVIPGIAFVRRGYTRLDYRVKGDRDQADTNERGIALFQYDGAKTQSQPGYWRLFYEGARMEGNTDQGPTLIPPGSQITEL